MRSLDRVSFGKARWVLLTLLGSAAVSGQVTWLSPMGASGMRALYTVATNGTQHVALGSMGGIVRYDGTWSAGTRAADDVVDIQGVTWANGRFVAVGDSGAILNSTNQYAWTRQTSGTSSRLWAIASSGSGLVAVGEGVLLTSPDGSAWTSRSFPGGGTLLSALWAGTRWIVFRDQDTGGVLTSTNGVDWTLSSTGKRALRSGVWTGDRLVGFGDQGLILASSDGGVTWTVRHPALATARPRAAAVWTGSYVVSFEGDTARMSREGLDWFAYPITDVGGYPALQAAWTGKEFLIVRAGGIAALYTSTLLGIPGRPILSYPYDAALPYDTVTLEWYRPTSGSPLSSYQVQVATDTAFTTFLLNDSTITGIQKSLQLPAGGTYYWRVRSVNIMGVSTYSIRGRFTTGVTALREPSHSGPAALLYARAGVLRVTFARPGKHVLRVTEVNGGAVFSGTAQGTLSVEGLKPGFYFVSVTAPDGSKSVRRVNLF